MLRISLTLVGLNIYFCDVFFWEWKGFKKGYIEMMGFFLLWARIIHYYTLLYTSVNCKRCGYIQVRCTSMHTCWKGNQKIQKIQNIIFCYSTFSSWFTKWNNGHYIWYNKLKSQCCKCIITCETHGLNLTYLKLVSTIFLKLKIHQV